MGEANEVRFPPTGESGLSGDETAKGGFAKRGKAGMSDKGPESRGTGVASGDSRSQAHSLGPGALGGGVRGVTGPTGLIAGRPASTPPPASSLPPLAQRSSHWTMAGASSES